MFRLCRLPFHRPCDLTRRQALVGKREVTGSWDITWTGAAIATAPARAVYVSSACECLPEVPARRGARSRCASGSAAASAWAQPQPSTRRGSGSDPAPSDANSRGRRGFRSEGRPSGVAAPVGCHGASGGGTCRRILRAGCSGRPARCGRCWRERGLRCPAGPAAHADPRGGLSLDGRAAVASALPALSVKCRGATWKPWTTKKPPSD
jgi:hypothetical protein